MSLSRKQPPSSKRYIYRLVVTKGNSVSSVAEAFELSESTIRRHVNEVAKWEEWKTWFAAQNRSTK